MDKLAGVILCYNAAKFDYCYLQAIQNLLDFCDHVVIVAGGTDETFEKVYNLKDEKITLIEITEDEWTEQVGKEKLAYFQNQGIEMADKLGFQYVYLGQADEIVSPKSFKHIREAIQEGHEGYMCHRINLWKDAYHYLQVPENRQPCSTNIARLSKVNYRSYGDGESINVLPNISFVELIQVFHYGFIRNKKIMKDKVINMQRDIFGVTPDSKLDGADEFIPERWFSGDDLGIINEPHPEIMKEWILHRP